MAALTRITNRSAGYGTMTGPCGNVTYEADTATCRHCNYVWFVRSTRGKDASLGGWCGMCSAMICDRCAGQPCKPFEKRLDEMEARDRALRSMGV